MKLKELYFKNYLLLGSGQITFDDGFNAITGETGAGKSMLIGIINLLKGDKIIWDRFKSNESVEITGIFETYDSELIVRRTINPEKRRSRFFINDTPVTRETIIEKIGKHIEISSQHQSSTLLDEETHIDYLDILLGITEKRSEMILAFKKWTELKNELNRKLKELKELKEKKEFLKFKLNELVSLNTHSGEEKELEEEIYILENLEELKRAFEEGIALFYEDKDSVYEKVSAYIRVFGDTISKDKGSKELISMIENIMINAEELFNTFKEKLNALTLDSDTLEEKRKRLFELRKVMRKYGLVSSEDILKEIERIKRDLETLGGEVDEIGKLQNEVHIAEKEVRALASGLSQLRRKELASLEEKISSELKKLGFPKIKFKVEINDVPLYEKGIDKVRFLITTSEKPPSPIKYVASGGELSRILLAFKVLTSGKDSDKLLVFDEIDTGIGGKTAKIVGERLKELSLHSQVIVITHLPQIAAFADSHYLVERDGHTSNIKITKLSQKERILEIARMLSGDKITESAVHHAKTLMEESKNG